jgi:hypothetical protein
VSNQIGPLTVKLTANAEGVKTGMDEATKQVDAGGDKMAKAAEKASKGMAARMIEGMKGVFSGAMDWGSTIGGLFEKMLGNPGRFIADNILGSLSNLANRIPVLGPLLAAPFDLAASAISAALDTFDTGKVRIMEMGKAAAAANVDLSQFQVIQNALGTDANTTSLMLTKMQKSLTEMALAGPDANNAVTRLGLSAEKLLQMPVEKMMGTFGDGLGTLGSRFLQTSYASEVFGRGSNTIMAGLMRGTKEIEKYRKLIDGFGAGVGASDFENVRAVEKASKEFKFFKEGFANQVTVGMAAVLAEVADRIPKLSELGITFKGLAGYVVDYFEAGARAWGVVIEAFSNTEVIVKAWGVIEAGFKSMLANMLADAKDAFLSLHTLPVTMGMDAAAGMTSTGAGIVASLTAKLSGVKAALLLGAQGAAGVDVPGLAAPGLLENAKMLADAKKAPFDGFGERAENAQSRFAKAMEDMKDAYKRSGTTKWLDDVFSGIRGRLADTGQAGKDNDPFAFWYESAGRLQERLEGASPFSKIKQGMAEIKALTQGGPVELVGQGGVVRINPNTGMPLEGQQMFAGLAEKASFALFSSLKSYMPSYTPVGAAERGSLEAYSAEAAYRGAATENIQEVIKNIQEAILKEAEEQNNIGRNMLDAIINGNFAVGNLD